MAENVYEKFEVRKEFYYGSGTTECYPFADHSKADEFMDASRPTMDYYFRLCGLKRIKKAEINAGAETSRYYEVVTIRDKEHPDKLKGAK